MNFSRFMPLLFAALVTSLPAEPVDQRIRIVNGDLADLGDVYRNALVVAEKPVRDDLVAYSKQLATDEAAARKGGNLKAADELAARLQDWNAGTMPDGTANTQELQFLLKVRGDLAKTEAMGRQVIKRLSGEGKGEQAKLVQIRLEALREELNLGKFNDAEKSRKTLAMVIKVPGSFVNSLRDQGSRDDVKGYLMRQGVNFPPDCTAVLTGDTLVIRNTRSELFVVHDLLQAGVK